MKPKKCKCHELNKQDPGRRAFVKKSFLSMAAYFFIKSALAETLLSPAQKQEQEDLFKQIDNLSDEKLAIIADKLCGEISRADSIGFKPKRFKEHILKHFEMKVEDTNANQFVSRFLNTHKQKLICNESLIFNDKRKTSI